MSKKCWESFFNTILSKRVLKYAQVFFTLILDKLLLIKVSRKCQKSMENNLFLVGLVSHSTLLHDNISLKGVLATFFSNQSKICVNFPLSLLWVSENRNPLTFAMPDYASTLACFHLQMDYVMMLKHAMLWRITTSKDLPNDINNEENIDQCWACRAMQHGFSG